MKYESTHGEITERLDPIRDQPHGYDQPHGELIQLSDQRVLYREFPHLMWAIASIALLPLAVTASYGAILVFIWLLHNAHLFTGP